MQENIIIYLYLYKYSSICRSPGCGSIIHKDNIEVTKSGAGLRVKARCAMSHKTTWSSCEFFNQGRTSAIDVLIGVYALVIGLNMSQIFEFFRQLNLAICSRASFYRLQSVYVNPIVYSYWTRMQKQLQDHLKQIGRPITLTGDGQFDSPGFSASYCFYSAVETTTNKVLDFYVATKSMTEYSAKMEPFATKVIMARLYKNRVNVRVCTTDRSSLMKKLFKDLNARLIKRGKMPIKHTYDVWHMVKAVTKDLFHASKRKKCQVLGDWIRSVANMMWYAFDYCNGNADLLREMILSIPDHIANKHTFPDNKLFKKCLHGDLPKERLKPWLRKDSLSTKKIVAALRGKKDCRIKDISMMTEFNHTGVNEQLNNLHNVYLPKNCFFGHPQAVVRAALTCIDHNSNVNRKQALDQDGDGQYNIVNSRDGLVWTAKPVKEPKNTSWRGEIAGEVLQVNILHIIYLHMKI